MIYTIALTLFLVTNPIGNSPAILALVKDYPFERQKWIMLRETFFALVLALFFLFVGHAFLALLGVEVYTLSLCGGVLLVLVGIGMVFPSNDPQAAASLKQEPYFVPIATPLLSGAGLMSIMMTFASQVNNQFIMVSALLLAWVGVTAVMLAAPYLLRLFGQRGMLALEQLMGLVLIMISTDMIVTGAGRFMKTL